MTDFEIILLFLGLGVGFIGGGLIIMLCVNGMLRQWINDIKDKRKERKDKDYENGNRD